MSGGSYEYLFRKDWRGIYYNRHLIRRAMGDAYFHGYEDLANTLRNFLKDYNADPGTGYQEELGEHTFEPSNQGLVEDWADLKEILMHMEWWQSGDHSQETFEEKLEKWREGDLE